MEKVLYIDDDSMLNALVSTLLRQQGIQVDCVLNGAEGWQKLMDSEYDLIVCDIQMPEMDGMQLYAQVTQAKPHLARRFIFVTGAVDSERVQTFLRESGRDYLQKPFTHDMFIDVLWHAWDRCVAEDHQAAGGPIGLPNTHHRTERENTVKRPRGESMSRARVVAADDHPDILDSITRLLTPEFDVVGTAADGQSAVETTAFLEPDVLILDISMPVLSGIEAATRVAATGSRTRVLFLTVHEDVDMLRKAMEKGASGYVIKSRMASDLVPAIKRVLAGRSYVSFSQKESS